MPRLTITVADQVAQPYRFSLERQVVHFGRGDDNDVHIDSGSVSSEHCVMERVIGGYVLKDLGSTNGIKLNGERVDEINLRNDQDIHIGDVVFAFQLSEEEMTALRLEDPTASLPRLNEPPVEMTPEPTAEKRQAPQPEPLPDIRKPPPPQQAPAQVSSKPGAVESAGNSGKSNTLIVALAIIAFLVGVAMHFERSTGKSFINSLMKKVTATEVAQ